MHFSYFGFELRNVKDAVQFYYKKELQDLTERGILELHLIKELPSYYNPIRNKAKLDKKVNEVMNRKR